MKTNNSILDLINTQIAANKVILPSPPDILIKIKQAINTPDSDINNIAKIISYDPALSARLIKVSNAALYRGNQEISAVNNAIMRLGIKLTHTLVTSHAITQMFIQPDKQLQQFYQHLQQQSIDISAHAYAIAKNYSRISPDSALLAGLIHNIGYLPLAGVINQLIPEQEDLNIDYIIDKLGDSHINVGKSVLKSWAFPQEIIDAYCNYTNHNRTGSDDIDLTDILLVASLNIHRNTEHPCTLSDWSDYPALKKMGIDSNDKLEKLDELESDIEKVKEILHQ